MIKRIVKMTFDPARVADFKAIFEESSPRIRAFEGCRHLELWQAKPPHDNILFTFSHWEDEAALNVYRASDLFATTWARTKVLFADKPEAWSVE